MAKRTLIAVLMALAAAATGAVPSSAIQFPSKGAFGSVRAAQKIATVYGPKPPEIPLGFKTAEFNSYQCQKSAKAPGIMIRWTPLARITGWKAEFVNTLPAFLKVEALIAFAFFASTLLLGSVVRSNGGNANYTRKVLSAIMIVVPFLIARSISYTPNPLHFVASILIFFLVLLMFAERFRRRFPLLDTAFAAIDRPEDKPLTLSWFLSAYLASSFLLLVMMWWAVPDQPVFVMVALAAVAIGDLLAGAVGHRFGRHRYKTTALFTNKTYTRSLEGSACVFLTTIVALCVFGQSMPPGAFWLAFFVLPISLTLAEAWSPHTWDEPVMFATAIVVSMAIVKAGHVIACGPSAI